MALDAAGFEWIIVETAGVGQTELDVLKLAHAVCVVLVPESGDGIQVMKAGLMEIADLFVVNKSDRPEADKLARELMTMVGMNEMHSAHEKWKIPVLKTQALFNQGIDELLAQLQEYRAYAREHGVLAKRRLAFIEDEIAGIILDEVSRSIRSNLSSATGRKIVNAVYNLVETPYEASEKFYHHKSDQKTLK